MRIIAGLEAQDCGEVRIAGRLVDGVPPRQRDVAMVFQSYALYPYMTVAHLQTVVNRSKEPAAVLAQMAKDVEGLLPKRA